MFNNIAMKPTDQLYLGLHTHAHTAASGKLMLAGTRYRKCQLVTSSSHFRQKVFRQGEKSFRDFSDLHVRKLGRMWRTVCEKRKRKQTNKKTKMFQQKNC